MEICWLTTSKCNQNCKYCDRFQLNYELNREDYFTILQRLSDYGVKQLTFGGGESLLVSCFSEIVKNAYANDIHLKLVTNGKLIPENTELIKYFDEITLSIDSLNDDMNERLGRGKNHRKDVDEAIYVIKKSGSNTRLNINTVVTKLNCKDVSQMGSAIANWGIYQWRIFRFCPLRGTAKNNKAVYSITDNEFENVRKTVSKLDLDCKIQYRNHSDMEKGYLLIAPHGILCISRDFQDIEVGNILTDDLHSWFIN